MLFVNSISIKVGKKKTLLPMVIKNFFFVTQNFPNLFCTFRSSNHL